MTDATLLKFEEKMLKEVSPLEVKSRELLAKSKAIKEVKDNATLASAVAIKKEINAHGKLIKDMRLELTRPLDDLKKQIMAKETEVTLPLEQAKTDISEKILTYEEEQERIKQEEENRVNEIKASLEVNVYSLTTIEIIESEGKRIKDIYAKLDPSDAENMVIKLAFKGSVDSLIGRKTAIEEEERQRLERERLAKEAEKMSAERAELERQKAEVERKEREVQAEKERQMRELERQALEAEALKQAKEEAKADKEKPKSNIATITEFEIENESLVDRIFCSPDNVKIRQAIKEGMTEIAGVRIFQTKKVR